METIKKNKVYKIVLPIVIVAVFFAPQISLAATLSVSPSNVIYSAGQSVAMKVTASSIESINAISGKLVFPPALFSIQSVSKANSILSFWVIEPSFSRASGLVSFEGIALAGFQGNNGTVLTVNLLALKEGSGEVTFQSGEILANDGQGTDATSGLNKAIFTITPSVGEPTTGTPEETEQITPITTPQPTAPGISIDKLDQGTIYGVSQYPLTEVLLTFVLEDGTEIFASDVTDGSGQFEFLTPEIFKSGAYSVTAIIVLGDGTQSAPSNTLQIEEGKASDTYANLYIYANLLLALILLLTIVYVFSKRRSAPLKEVTPPVTPKQPVQQPNTPKAISNNQEEGINEIFE